MKAIEISKNTRKEINQEQNGWLIAWKVRNWFEIRGYAMISVALWDLSDYVEENEETAGCLENLLDRVMGRSIR